MVCHLRRHPNLVDELDMSTFVAREFKSYMFRRASRSLTRPLAGTQDWLSPTQHVPLWKIPLEKSTSQKQDM